MKPLLKIMAILTLIFVAIFLLGRAFDLLTIETIRALLSAARQINPGYIFAAILLLLWTDIILSIPTLATLLLAGFFLGFPVGAAAGMAGLTLAMLTGYGLSAKFGDRALMFLTKNDTERMDLSEAFSRNGPAMIMLARSLPMAPEVTACLAGATGMPILRYLMFFLLGTLPYVAIAVYAGSVSTFNDPQPAIFAILALYGLLWIGWFGYHRYQKKYASPDLR